MRVIIIAEAGVNHNGDINLAYEMIKVAKDCDVDAIKFQTAVPELVMTRFAPMANYQINNIGKQETQLEMAKRIHLPLNVYKELKIFCDKLGIKFLSTPFDDESIELLNSLGLEFYKIPSGEITNLPYLKHIGKLKKKVILSTGMADLGEIEDAIDILVDSGTPRENITLLHCTTEYPAPIEEVNLNAILTLKNAFKLPVGYSDHTTGIEVPIAAVALGAIIIEKHFTLDKNLPGPDHKASLEPHELKQMVSAIRNIEKALGNGIKKPSPSELKNREIARKSIVAKTKIKKGEIFTEENLTTKRPGTGISPMRWSEFIGKITNRDYEEDELIEI